MSGVCLLLISDGREEYFERTMVSIGEMLPAFDHVVHVEDPEHKLGFAGAIAEGWRRVRDTEAQYVWHQEQDFTINEPVDLVQMIGVLEWSSYLVQIALKRQPWNHEERAAGGIVECHPDDFTERHMTWQRGRQVLDSATWTEHCRYFTTNPSLYRASLCDLGWPQEAESEGKFTHRLLKSPRARFAIWGSKFDAPRCTHIGVARVGVGY